MSAARIFAGLVAVCAGALLVGCTSNRQIRTYFDSSTDPADPEKAVLEHGSGYQLGFVEFDDQGWFWDRRQLEAVTAMIREQAGFGGGEARGLIVLTFVHGWKHNASTKDANVEMVRKVLRRLSEAEENEAKSEGRPARAVVGVYGGWRGLSATLEPFEELSFWDRKNTAHQVGHGSLTELLVTLERLQQDCNARSGLPRTDLILVGHSFGGAAMYSALSQIVAERYVNTIERGKRMKPLGDLILLLNPAFEASRHYNLNDLATSAKRYPDDQRPVLAIFTSKGDWATHYAFPVGRFFSTLFESYRGDGKHDDQGDADREAVGWFTPFRTHQLDYDADAKARTPEGHSTLDVREKKPKHKPHDAARLDRSMANVRDQRGRWSPNRERPVEYSFDDCVLKPESSYREGDPILVVSVDERIMKDHDDIGNEVLINFLREFIVFCRSP
jgi:hypothetical protein